MPERIPAQFRKLRVEERLDSFEASLFGLAGEGGSRSVFVLERSRQPEQIESFDICWCSRWLLC